MAWNEPGRGKDPWRGSRNAAGDLDAFLRDLQQRLGAGGQGPLLGALLGAFVIAIWLALGFYEVDDAQRGVVQRFGRYLETAGTGLHWRVPWPVDTVTPVDVSQVRTFTHKTVMLTGDETLVSLDVEVLYRAVDARAFLFGVREPEETLGQVVSSAIREGIGKTKIDDIIDGIPPETVIEIKALTQRSLDAYGTGLVLTSFNFKNVQFPDQVQEAQNDAIKAREDKETSVLSAQAYANDVLPKARGQAVRDVQDAEAYKARVVAQAEGEGARFDKLLGEYQKAPGVTRERLYLDTMEQVLGANAKVLITTKGQGNVIYLPLDQLRRTTLPPLAPGNAAPTTVPTPADPQDARARDDARNRGGR